MAEIEKHQCAERVSQPPHYLHRYPCARPATINEDGKWWCAVHALSKVVERDAKRTRKWDTRWAEENEEARRLAIFPKLLAAAEQVLIGLEKYGVVYKPVENDLKEAVAEAKGKWA